MRGCWLLVAALAACGDEEPGTDPADTTDSMDTIIDTVDTVASCGVADPPVDVMLTTTPFSTIAPTVVWSDAASPCAATERFEVALGTSVGSDDVLAWAPIDTSATWQATGLVFDESTTYVASVRRVDIEGNVSDAASSEPWLVWTPKELPGKVLWLDARSGTFGDTDCAAEVAENREVLCWMDRSGHGNNARVTAPTRTLGGPPVVPPRVDETGWSGHRALDFSGHSRLIALNDPSLDVSAHFSVFVVHDYAPPNFARAMGYAPEYILSRDQSWRVTVINRRLLGELALDASGVVAGGSWSAVASNRPAESGRHLEVVQLREDSWAFRHDGLLDHEVARIGSSTDAPRSAGGALSIGAATGYSYPAYDASIAEILVVDGVLTDDLLAHIETYLMSRWSLELASPYVLDSGDTGTD